MPARWGKGRGFLSLYEEDCKRGNPGGQPRPRIYKWNGEYQNSGRNNGGGRRRVLPGQQGTGAWRLKGKETHQPREAGAKGEKTSAKRDLKTNDTHREKKKKRGRYHTIQKKEVRVTARRKGGKKKGVDGGGASTPGNERGKKIRVCPYEN